MDVLINPLRLILTEGERHDITQAVDLIAGLESDYVIAVMTPMSFWGSA